MTEPSKSTLWKAYPIPLVFAAVKLLIHLLTNTNYGLHRDEYLYLELGRHLYWGYMEVPPFISWVAWIINSLGADIWVVRLFPTLAGVLTIFLIGWQVKRLGGSQWAQALACLGFLVAPAFLRGNTLFQPVSFNQFFWFLSCILFVELARTENKRIWYAIGLVAGLGILTKYSIAFLYLGLLVGILATAQRKWLKTSEPYRALAIAFLIASPNLIWQLQHRMPILAHMQELARTQLVNVEPGGFLFMQILMLFGGIVLVLAGLVFLFRNPEMEPFRFLGIAALTTVLIIALLSGKPYYTLGAYSILLVFGGLGLDHWIRRPAAKWAVSVGISIGTLVLLPYALLVLPLEQMRDYSAFMSERFGLKAPLRWEDGNYYEIPQDYADMVGWEEMVQNLARFYHSLREVDHPYLLLQGGSYGHAGAINYFRKKYDLPEAVSFSGSYRMWAPDEMEDIVTSILVDDRKHESFEFFNRMILVDSTSHPLARDPGYIYYRFQPKVNLERAWREVAREQKAEFNF